MIYIYSGDNDYETKKSSQKLIIDFVRQHGELALERLDGEEKQTAEIIDALQSMPFLGGEKMVVVTSPSKELLDQLDAIEMAETTTALVIVGKPDKRAAYYKKITKLPGYKDFTNTKNQNTSQWVVDHTKKAGGSIALADARFLVDRVGANQMLLASEIEKLVLYNPQVTRQSIELLCEPSPQTTVFQLLDAAFAGKVQIVERLYAEQRAQKVEPLAILGMIAWQLHILALIKSAGDKSPDTIAKEAKLNPYVVRKSHSIARNVTMNQIKQMVADALQLDINLKSKPIDADEAMLVYLLTLKKAL